MQPKKLNGVVANGVYSARDGDGKKADPVTAIFPILKQGSDGQFTLLGTGFFISDNGIFVTAKHVLLDVLDRATGEQTHALLLIQIRGDGSYIPRPILRCTSHDSADITVGIAAPLNHNVTGEELKNKILNLKNSVPAVGRRVSTYAYPASKVFNIGELSEKTEFWFYSDFFDGVVEELHLEGRDRTMLPGPCMRTSMYVHGGASGGPVFDSSGKVIGVNSTGFTDDNLSYITPIYTIENLVLTDVNTSTNKTGSVRVRELIQAGFISYLRIPGAQVIS